MTVSPSPLDCKILVADDDEMIRELLGRLLKEAGYTGVEFAVDGATTIRALYRAEPHFDLLILDLDMPGLNGHEVLSWRLKDPHLQLTKVIILSGLTAARARAKPLDGSSLWVEKPFTPARLLAAVRRSCPGAPSSAPTSRG